MNMRDNTRQNCKRRRNPSSTSQFIKRLSSWLVLTTVLTVGTAHAASLYWDTDGTTSGNNVDGTGLGGTSGFWNTGVANWWDLSSLVVWPNTSADEAIFSAPYVGGAPLTRAVTISTGVTANRLTFERSGYVINGGTLTLAGANPTLNVNLGESVTIDSLIQGVDGLNKTGGGTVRLAAGNTYTGTTTIGSGAIIITDQSGLGASSSAVVVAGASPTIGSTTTRGFGGGSLVLDGTGGDILFTRDLSLQGHGAIADRGSALVSTGNNTLSGTVTLGAPFSGTNINTRVIAADGSLNFTGTLNVLGAVGTTVSNLGGVNQAGASFYNITGVLAGTGTLESSGGGTLFLNPSDVSGFSGSIRVSGSAASGQSVVRIDSPNVLGTRTATGTTSVLDLNGGILAVLMDAPSVLAGGSAANVYLRASSTIFADHTPNSSVKDQTVTFGQLAFEDGQTLSFNSRNGYGMTFSAAPVVTGDGDSTFANNLQGGALLTFTGTFWSNGNNAANRTMTFSGNGNTLISGNITASAASFNHNLSKSGTGTLTITSTGSTLDGNVSVTGGTVAITDFRSITNNGSTISLNGGALSVIGNNVAQANLTTSKVINLSGTTGSATILASQTGTSPGLILNADFTATGAGTKTLTLGGANTGANTINGAIVQNGTTNVTKIDAGRWVLAGANAYTGATTITNGVLQLKANAAASTILADASAITFGAVNNYAGGTLEFVGQASTNNVETLGAITYASGGAATVKLTPGSGGTASLVFANISTGATGTINFVDGDFTNNKFTLTQVNAAAGSDGIVTRSIFWNGADYAYRQGGVLRAPVYGVDTGTATSASALTAALNNQITGSFATNSISIPTLKINGGHTLTINGGQTLTLTGAGVLATGGASTITGGTIALAAAPLVARVNGGADSLRIESVMTGTGGLTKSGAGTLVLAGANTQTGTIHIAEGTVRLASGGTLGGAAALTIRQDGVLEMNGITPTNITNAFINNGIVRNTSATTDVVFTVGGSNGAGDSRGIIEDGGVGNISVVKVGTGGQNWLGLSTYTGTTTIGSTGIVGINNLENGGSASGIGASSNAASNLIFNGSSATQAYGGLSYTGTTNDATDRLFTFDGGANGGARIQSNGVNGATSSWTNTGALAFGASATGQAQGLVLGGSSTGDNRFAPLITDNGATVTNVYKADAGVWYLGNNNTYTGVTQINAGTLYAQDGVNIMKGAGATGSNIVLNGGSLAATGAFVRGIGTGGDQIQWTANGSGGFSAGGTTLTVDLGTGNVWGTTAGFLGTGALLLNNSGVAKSDVDIISGFEITLGAANVFNATTSAGGTTVTLTSGTTAGLAVGQSFTGNPNIPSTATIATITGPTTFTLSSGTGVLAGTSAATTAVVGGFRQINVGDFTSVGADFATISGNITGAGNLAKEGAGILNLRGANTYTGQTLVRQGTLVVETLGLSTNGPGATSVGQQSGGNTNAGAVLLGSGGTAGILEYVGRGEISDRKIAFSGTTGGAQIHADGVGALILTNVLNDVGVGGAKTLNLRGVSAAANMITSQLSDNGGALNITVDGSTAWILTNAANNYTGTTAIGAGALGIGADTALGTGNVDLSNGSVFAYGADRTIANPVRFLNNSGPGFIGDYSLTFTQPLQILAGGNNLNSLFNNIVADKSLTFTGLTANALTGSRAWTIDGSGTTIFAGDFTTSTAFGVAITKTGDGILQLNGTASNFNQASQNFDIDRGTLQLGNSEVIPHGAGFGNVILSPELANGDTATLDLNGRTETINGLTATTDGTVIIDNTAASPASLIFGANDAAVAFGGGVGTYTITDSGAGALSITKTGAAAVVIPNGVTLTYQGSTNVNGGSLSIASAVNGTTGLSATGGATLALTGGITNPSAVTSVTVGGGSTLTLLDGAGSQISNLTTLNLGNTGTGAVTLNLNVGDVTLGDKLNTDTLSLLTGNVANFGNTIVFNMTDAGLNAGQTYTLLSVADGGLSAFGLGNFIQGATPGGFDSFTWEVQDTFVRITTGNLIVGSLYWRGLTNATWNGNVNNWSQDKLGATPALSTPGQGTAVIFQWDAPTNAAVVTTLEQNFKINSLTFEASTNPANTPTSVTINPGTVTTNRLEVAPTSSSDGIKITAGGPAVATISGSVRLGANQTWEVADATSVLSLGSLFGEADVTKTGLGKVTLSAAANGTFNGGDTADVAINAGALEILSNTALGSAIDDNLANVAVNSGGLFYYNNATSGTVANQLTLNGGTLAAAGNSQTYSGAINLSADSTVSTRDAGVTVATTRTLTLSGVLSGAGKMTINGNSAVSSGNSIAGTVVLTQANPLWSGGVLLQQGTIDARNVDSLGTGAVTVNMGRILFKGAQGTTWNQLSNGLTVNNPGANAVVELQPDNQGAPGIFTTNISGTTTMGSATSAPFLRIYHADTLSALEISGSVILGANASIHTSGGGTTGYQPVLIDGVISDGGSGFSLLLNGDTTWGSNNYQVIQLAAANTFSGNLTLAAGPLEFSTVSNIGGPASNLGQGAAISIGTGTLRFVGTTAQTTDRPITQTGAATYSANGTGAGSITYTGAISAAGNNFTLTGASGSLGEITGGINQTGDAADATVSGGTWTISGLGGRVADGLTISGTDAVLNVSGPLLVRNDVFVIGASSVLNLNTTGALSFSTATLSGDASLRVYSGGVINFAANDSVVLTDFDGLRIGTDGSGTGTLNMSTFNQSANEFILGNRNADRVGMVNGTGTLTVIGNLDLYKGTINANLASTGTNTLDKLGNGSVTLAGDNSGLASTGATIVSEGGLILDYTASNTTKLRALSQLEMRGADLTLIGNASAATSQTVGSFTLDSTATDDHAGANRVTLTPGVGQEIVLNLGAISRSTNTRDGTVRFVLPAGVQSATNGVTTTTLNTNGLVGVSAFAVVEDAAGTWFATNATNLAGGNIVGLQSVAKNDVSTWVAAEHITDETTGFAGTVSGVQLNSLRFNAATGSDLSLGSTGVLSLASGGLLVTSSVGGTPSIVGGTLVSGASASNVPELIITQDSNQSFNLGADIRINHTVTKTGAGTLLLSGNNVYTGGTDIMEGTLQVNGTGIGDNSLVTLALSRPTTLELLADETIGRLQGGGRNTDSDFGTVAIDTNTLTINQSGSTTYAGFFTGTGSIVMNAGNTGNLGMTNVSSGFTGTVVINGGLFLLSGIGQNNASSFTINRGGNLLLDNNGTTRSGTRILDTSSITLNSADGFFSGQNIPRGLAIRTDQDANTTETIGQLNFASGASYGSFEQQGGNNSRSIIIASDFSRTNSATFNVRGRAMGSNAGTGGQSQLKIVSGAAETAFLLTLVGGVDYTSGADNNKIVPWAIGENLTGGLAATNMGNTLVSYSANRGFVPLNLATEYATYPGALATDNIREVLTATDLTGLAGATINALVLHNGDTTASTRAFSGSGVGQALLITSGAMLFTRDTAGAAGYGILLSGFDDGIAVGGTNEYVIHVVNPDSAAATKTLTASISAPLTSVADITKSGRGNLVLSGLNTAGGGARKTTINEGNLEITDLDNIGGNTGALIFAGGTLRLSSTYGGDDISSRTISFLMGGGTIDTNGANLSLAGSVGSGSGGLTKTGLGNLTLGAAATYTGGTTLSGGTLTVGANNAIGIGGNLSLGAGTTFDLGTNSVNVGLVTTAGASPLITGTGTITASAGYFLNHTGDTTIDAILAGGGGLLKAQTNTVTLSGLSTYAGTTEIQAGTLSINSISNVGGGASALGNASTAENGIIRMGLTTVATTLNYTGSGHSSNRLIGMQGTTGGVTLDADGIGALGLGGVRFESTGNKSLTLRGSSDGSTVENTLGEIREIGGVLTLLKTDANIWALTATNTYTGTTTVADGTLRLQADQTMSAGLILGTATTAGAVDMQNVSAQFSTMTVLTNSTTLVNTVTIDAGETLTLTGNVTIGANAAGATTLFAATGGGSFVNNVAGGTFQIGGGTGATNTNAATADFSGLSSFTVDLGAAGTLRVGDNNSNSAGTPVADSKLILASTSNNITAGTINLGQGAGQGSSVQSLRLGAGTNAINADTINIGGNTTRSGGALLFDGATGSVVIRGVDGISPVGVINMTNGAISTGFNQINDLLLAGHSADVSATTVNMAFRSAGAGAATATLTFDEGTLDFTTLNMAGRTTAGSSGNATANVIIGGGTASIDALNMAVNTSAGGTVLADFNVSGGDVTIGTGSGTAINMANASTGRTAASTIDLTGGTTTVRGNIVRTGGAGTENATVTLAGGSLNMSGFSVGATGVTVSLVAESGTLTALFELNGGGAFTKTTGGELVMAGVNAYLGATNVNEGTVLVSGSLSGTASVAVQSGATLGGTGSINTAATVTVALGGTLAPGTSNSPGVLSTGNVDLSAATSTFKLELGGTAPGNLATEHDQLAVTGTVTLGGNASVSLFGAYFGSAQLNDTFTIILNDGNDAVVGTFANAPLNLLGGTDGTQFAVDYFGGDGNDVVLTLIAVPEPGALGSLLSGLGMLAGLQRFRRRKN